MYELFSCLTGKQATKDQGCFGSNLIPQPTFYLRCYLWFI